MTNKTTMRMEDKGEERHGTAKKVEGRRRGEKENLQVRIKTKDRCNFIKNYFKIIISFNSVGGGGEIFVEALPSKCFPSFSLIEYSGIKQSFSNWVCYLAVSVMKTEVAVLKQCLLRD